MPLSTSIAGVAMGLILGEQLGDKPVILTDILGLEDALGSVDMISSVCMYNIYCSIVWLESRV